MSPRLLVKTEWPLLERGWVFQEVYLSPRTLHFGSNQVVWQCRSKQALEPQPGKTWVTGDYGGFPPAFPQAPDELSRLYRYNTVQAYSWFTLTFSKDHLPTIAAMATRMQKHRPHDWYIAGLGQSSLCYDVKWSTEARHHSLPREVAVVVMQRIYRLSDPFDIRLPSSTVEKLRCVEVLDIAYTRDVPDVLGDI
jgi:hypothetical protein